MSRLGLWIALACTAACRTAPAESGHGPDAQLAVDAPPGLTGSPWESREVCQALVAAGQRAPRSATGLQITTWNVRWFPLGYAPFDTPKDTATDVAWLACTIVWLSPDVIVLEEVLGPYHSATALEQLRIEIERLEQQGPWEVLLEPCPSADMQHVAILYRTGDGLELLDTESIKLSSAGAPLCASGQRPAFVAHYDVGGSSLVVAGLHLKSGRGTSDYSDRRESMQLLGAAVATETAERFVVAGDFNSMGCRYCEPGVSGTEEVALIGDELLAAGLMPSAPAIACTQYTSGDPRLLDHLAVRGPGAGTPARVDGPCAELACASAPTTPPAFAHLSDHCPVSVELPR